MPTIEELGRRVKKKYPQYADLSDGEVGSRVKGKFPGSYDDFGVAAAAPVSPQPRTAGEFLRPPGPDARLAARQAGLLERTRDIFLGPGTALGRAFGTSGEPVSRQAEEGPAPLARVGNILPLGRPRQPSAPTSINQPLPAARQPMPTTQKYKQMPGGLLEPGNINLYTRPVVQNPDGTTSTVRSMSFEENGKEILVPTVSDDGRILSNDEAIANYHRTRKHLGIFDSPASATTYAQQLHNDYAAGKFAIPGTERTGLPGVPLVSPRVEEQPGLPPPARPAGEYRMSAREPSTWENIKGIVTGTPEVGETAGARSSGTTYYAPAEDQPQPISLPMLRFTQFTPDEGRGRGIAEFAEEMSTAPSLLMMAGSGGLGTIARQAVGKAGTRAVSGLFAADLIKSTVEGVREAERVAEEDPGRATTLRTKAGLTGLMGLAATKHAATGRGVADIERLRRGKAAYERMTAAEQEAAISTDPIAKEAARIKLREQERILKETETPASIAAGAATVKDLAEAKEPVEIPVKKGFTVQPRVPVEVPVKTGFVPEPRAPVEIQTKQGAAPPPVKRGYDVPAAPAKVARRAEEPIMEQPAVGTLPSVPSKVQRFEEKGVVPSGPDKPHGLYTIPADLVSPHAYLGGEKRIWKTNPEANVLSVDASIPSGSDKPLSAGNAALKQLLGAKEFDQQYRKYIRTLSHQPGPAEKAHLAKVLNQIYPKVDWNRYYDTHEMLEGYGGMLARERGYDAIWGPDRINPEFSEYVALTDKALQPTVRAGVPPSPEKGAVIIPRETVEGLKNFAQDVRTEWVDRFDPIRQLTKDKGLTAESDPYIAARKYSGHVGKIDNRLEDLRKVLRPAAEEGLLDRAVQHAVYERFEELAIPVPGSKNIARVEGIKKFPGDRSIEQIRQEKLAIEQGLADRGELQRVREVSEQLRGYSRRLVDESFEAGVISGEAREHLSRAENQKYMPLNRLFQLADDLEGGRIVRGSNAFSVASQNLYQKIKGSTAALDNPLEQMIRATYSTIALSERNKVALKMADLSKLPQFEGVVTRLKGTKAVPPRGHASFHVLRGGIKEEYSAPTAVVEAMKGLNDRQIDVATKFASIGTRALRAGATSMNLAFFIPNLVRDAHTAKLVSKTGFGVRDWTEGVFEAMRRGDVFRQYMEQGASFSGFFERQGGVPRTLKRLTESTGKKVARKVVNPVELLRIVGETSELSTRLGVFKRSIRMGMTPSEAAFNARNATIDFAKMGTKMRVANMWVPFLNARLQGTLNTYEAVRTRPANSGLILGYTVALPVVATYLMNQALYPHVLRDIAQWEKDNNFIFIYGDEQDDDGNYTQITKIPKGDVGRIFGNPLENALEGIVGKDSKSTRELFLEIVSDISPVGFEKEGKVSATTALSGVTPPTMRGIGEVATNKKWFFGSPVIPRRLEGAPPSEQYTEQTPRPIRLAAKGLAAITKPTMGAELSPIELGHMIEAQFGGVGRQISKGELPSTAVGRRFFGAQGRGEEERGHARLTELQTEQTGERVRQDRAARELYQEMKAMNPEERRRRAAGVFAAPGGKEILSKVVEMHEEEATGATSLERRLRTGSTDVRARFIFEELQKATPSERAAQYAEWKAQKIITSAVEDKLKMLIQ